MKNIKAMQDAIFKVFVKDLDKMTREELIAELTFYIEKDIYNMESEDIRSNYEYMQEMGEA